MGNCFGSNAAELEAVEVMAHAHHAHPQGMIPTLVWSFAFLNLSPFSRPQQTI
jgi:hypothetical protein